MTPGAAFGWGSVGGATMGFVVFVLPPLVKLARSGEVPRPTAWQFVATVGTVVVLAAIGGVVALTQPEDSTRSHLIVAGLVSQTVIKGILAAGKEALGDGST